MAEILSGGLTWGSIQQAIVTMDKEGHPLTCCNPVTGECLGGGGSSDIRNIIQTIEISAQTLTGAQIEGQSFYGASVKIGELNANLPIPYNDSYNWELFGAVDNLAHNIRPNFSDYIPMPENSDEVRVAIAKAPNSNDIMIVAQGATPFSIDINNHTLVIYTANNTVLEAFPGGIILAGK